MRVFSALKLMVTSVGTLGTVFLLERIVILSAILSLSHRGVGPPGIPGGGPAGPVRGQGPAWPAP